jgi:serine/threonine protein kinase
MPEDEVILASAHGRVGLLLHGKYHIDGVLGVGGMATVYAATHRNRKRFAVKLLHPEYAVRSDIRTRFVREGYVANSVNHPGVVSVLDDDVDEVGAPFLVMELLEGVSVEALYATKREPVAVREVLGIAHQLLEVLEAAHQNAITHRDIKPANLFLQKSGQLKVLDFGIARLKDSDQNTKSTKTGAMLGTPAFMAPEQAMAEPGDIDARTDIWGVGATLFTLLSARFVHEGENARQIMIRAATEPARSLDGIVPDLPAAVVELVARALRFEKSERWQTAAEMGRALLDVHRTLFGEPDRAHLVALAERVATEVSAAPTEASALRGDEPQARLEPAASVTRSFISDDRGIVTTTATPVSTHSDRGHSNSASKLLLVAGSLAIGAGLVIALGKGAGEEPRRTEPAATNATTTAPPSEPATTRAEDSTRTPVNETPTSTATTSATNVVPSTQPTPRRAPNAKSKSEVAAKPPAATRASAVTVATAKPDATPTSPAPKPASNPLQLELQ